MSSRKDNDNDDEQSPLMSPTEEQSPSLPIPFPNSHNNDDSDLILSLEDRNASIERRDKLLKVYLIFFVIYIILTIIFAGFFFFDESFKAIIVNFFGQFKEYSFTNIGVLFIIGVFFKLVGLPISIYELAVSYMLQAFWVAVGICSTAKLTGCFIAFSISKRYFHVDLKIWMHEFTVFQTFEKAAEKHPFRVACLLRFMVLPIVLKNYGIGLLKISNLHFLIPAALNCFFKSCFLCFIGLNLQEFTDIFASDNPIQSNFYLKLAMILFSILLYAIIFKICADQHRLIEQELARETQRDALNSIPADQPSLQSSTNNLQTSQVQ